jgi:hypothetical protein
MQERLYKGTYTIIVRLEILGNFSFTRKTSRCHVGRERKGTVTFVAVADGRHGLFVNTAVELTVTEGCSLCLRDVGFVTLRYIEGIRNRHRSLKYRNIESYIPE